MPSYPVATFQGRYRLGFNTVTSGSDGDVAWAGECGDDSQDISAGTQVFYYCHPSPKRVNITRNVLFFDTTGLSPSLEIETAGIYARTGFASWIALTGVNDWVHIVTCPDIHRPCVEADYGYLGGRNTPVASLYVPTTLSVKYRYLTLDANGIATINAGGITPFAIKHGKDIDITFPGWSTKHGCFFDSNYMAYLRINQPILTGYIWVEGTKLAYLDADRDKRLEEGTDTGANGTAGYPWVDGTYQYYVDANGDVRRIEGALTGLTGKTPSQVSINTAQGGTKFCYIDATGAERCFEGSLP